MTIVLVRRRLYEPIACPSRGASQLVGCRPVIAPPNAGHAQKVPWARRLPGSFTSGLRTASGGEITAASGIWTPRTSRWAPLTRMDEADRGRRHPAESLRRTHPRPLRAAQASRESWTSQCRQQAAANASTCPFPTPPTPPAPNAPPAPLTKKKPPPAPPKTLTRPDPSGTDARVFRVFNEPTHDLHHPAPSTFVASGAASGGCAGRCRRCRVERPPFHLRRRRREQVPHPLPL